MIRLLDTDNGYNPRRNSRKTIELERELGFQKGSESLSTYVLWTSVLPGLSSCGRPAVRPGKFVIKGTRLLVDDLVELVEQGSSDEELRRATRSFLPTTWMPSVAMPACPRE